MSAYRALEARFKRLADVRGALAVLHWDRQAMMPAGGNGGRGPTRWRPSRRSPTSGSPAQQTGALLDQATAEAAALDEWQAANLREMRRGPCPCDRARARAGRGAGARRRARGDDLARGARRGRLRAPAACARGGAAPRPRGGGGQGGSARPRALRRAARRLRAGRDAAADDRRLFEPLAGVPAGLSSSAC